MDELYGEPAGVLKLSIPPALALNLLSPLFSAYQKQYPKVNLDVHLESHLVDLVAEGYDLALRSATLQSSSLIAQRIFEIENIICASPAYLKKHGPIETPEMLTEHDFALYSQPNKVVKISLNRSSLSSSITLRGKLHCNQLELIKPMMFMGDALAILPRFVVRKELETHELKLVLPNYTLPSDNLYAIYPEREFMPPKLHQFLQMLRSFLKLEKLG